MRAARGLPPIMRTANPNGVFIISTQVTAQKTIPKTSPQ